MYGRGRQGPRRPELSQHFLRKGALAASLVRHALISSQDVVLEIGPGLGALTRELAPRCRRVVAVEVDGGFVRVLRAEFAGSRNVEVVHEDFFRAALPAAPFKVFANVPFARTAEIVRRLAYAEAPPEDAYLIVQREAAERFAGYPYAGETLQSVLLKPWWQVEIVRWLRRSDFEPPPQVDAVVLWLARRRRPLIEEGPHPILPHQNGEGTWQETGEGTWREFVTAGFAGQGASLRQRLSRFLSRAQFLRLAADLRFEPGSGPSEIGFEQWLGMYRYWRVEGGRRVGGGWTVG